MYCTFEAWFISHVYGKWPNNLCLSKCTDEPRPISQPESSSQQPGVSHTAEYSNTTITLKPILELKIAGEVLSTLSINLRSFRPIRTLLKFVSQPKDPITLHRLIVSKNYWRRSGGGGAKMEVANWIVTIALLCHTVLPFHWLLSRPLITRMNGINLIIQWRRR